MDNSSIFRNTFDASPLDDEKINKKTEAEFLVWKCKQIDPLHMGKENGGSYAY